MKLLIAWLIMSLAVFLVAKLLPGVHVKSFGTALGVAAVYGIFHALLFRLLAFFTLPLVVLSLGVFLLVINAFLLWLTDLLIEDFKIDGPLWTLLASLLISVVGGLLRAVIF